MFRISIISLLLFLFVIPQSVHSQDQGNEVSLDMLRASVSPAFQLLEADVSRIDQPTETTDFIVSVLQNTDRLTSIPENYSLEIAPYWVFGGMNTSFASFTSDHNILNNIKQSLVFSIATIKSFDSLQNRDTRKVSTGIKLSILRGNKVSSKFVNLVEKLRSVNRKFTEFGSFRDNDKTYSELMKLKLELLEKEDIASADKINLLLDERESELLSLFNIDQSDEVKQFLEQAEETPFYRYGWKLDLAFGLALDFPTNDFNNSVVTNTGAWLTGGYEDEKSGLTGLALARFTGNPNDKLISGDKENFFDIGAKIILDRYKRFSIGGELLNRIVLKGNDKESRIRYTLDLSYELFKNKLLTFHIGKDFDSKPETGGNLIAVLNLILGFGSDRSIGQR